MIDDKKILAAPVQGWTDHVWRVAHAQVFGPAEAYYAPFMRVEHGGIRPRDLRDILPDNNAGIHVVPQVLACRPDDMAQMLQAVADMDYTEVNINLGCPHPPVARKGFGAGMLARPEALENLAQTLSQQKSLKVSLKMRLGWDDPVQWRNVLPLFNQVAVDHVIMHYRLGTQQYRGETMNQYISDTLRDIPAPVILNGDIDSLAAIDALLNQYPQAAGVMVGRALVADPALLCPDKATVDNYRRFHDLLYDGYSRALTGGDHQLLDKMQALWQMMLPHADHRAHKAIRKANTLDRYHQAVSQLFEALW